MIYCYREAFLVQRNLQQAFVQCHSRHLAELLLNHFLLLICIQQTLALSKLDVIFHSLEAYLPILLLQAMNSEIFVLSSTY